MVIAQPRDNHLDTITQYQPALLLCVRKSRGLYSVSEIKLFIGAKTTKLTVQKRLRANRAFITLLQFALGHSIQVSKKAVRHTLSFFWWLFCCSLQSFDHAPQLLVIASMLVQYNLVCVSKQAKGSRNIFGGGRRVGVMDRLLVAVGLVDGRVESGEIRSSSRSLLRLRKVHAMFDCPWSVGEAVTVGAVVTFVSRHVCSFVVSWCKSKE
jgi:hypothetical protein